MTKPRRAGSRRVVSFVGLGARIGTGFAVVAAFALAAVLLYFRGSSAGIGSSPRPADEQRRMLASGDCAVARDQSVRGKVAGQLGPSRSLPRGGYLLESIDRRRVLQVEFDDVRLVPCASLRR
jgi:hypothetical protein